MKETDNLDDIVIVSGVRTPFGRFDGPMRDIPSIDLAVIVMKEVIQRVGIKPEEVGEINYGGTVLAEMALETDVPARQATLLAGFPAENISVTLDRACCSSLTCVRLGVEGHKGGGGADRNGCRRRKHAPYAAPGPWP